MAEGHQLNNVWPNKALHIHFNNNKENIELHAFYVKVLKCNFPTYLYFAPL